MEYKNMKPYPEIKIEKPNIEYAKILLEDYAGNLSEDTAIHLYLYQSLATNEQLQEYKDIMMHISEVEMTHLKLLGETIVKLGMNPIYGTLNNDNVPRLWTASNVNYSTSLKKMLEIDIEAETQAIHRYQNQILIIKDKYIQNLLRRIIEDEQVHLNIFQTLYRKYFNK